MILCRRTCIVLYCFVLSDIFYYVIQVLYLCTFVTVIYGIFVTPEDKRNKIPKLIINVIWFMQIEVLDTTRDCFLVTHYKNNFFFFSSLHQSQLVNLLVSEGAPQS